MANFVNRCIFNAASSGTVDFVYASAISGFQSPAAAAAADGQIYSYSAQSASLAQWEYGTGVYTASTQTVARTTVLGNHLGSTAKIAFSTPPQVYLTPLAADLMTSIVVSTTAPGNPQPGQVWFNPGTGLESVARYPSYLWSADLSAVNVVLSLANTRAQRVDSTYPNFAATTQGAKSASFLPSAQKYVFALNVQVDLGGNSGFGIGDSAQPLNNGMFLGSPNPSHGIGYYISGTSAYVFSNNAVAASYSGSWPDGIYYIAVDPVAKLIWAKPTGGNWNNSAANNPATGAGGIALPAALDVTTSSILAQFFANGDFCDVDPAATGLGIVSGFTPLSQVVLWETLSYVNPSGISAGWVNIKDFGAAGDGVAEDGPSFQAFTLAYQGQKVCLYIPPGTYNSGSNTLGLWRGISQLTIFGYGATLNSGLDPGLSPDSFWSTSNAALIQTATIGDAQLTLVTPADASKFAANDWIIVSALDIQGSGLPANAYFVEYVQVTSVSGGLVFLNTTLRDGPYKSTYPYYNSNSSGVDEGGPAMIRKMPFGWDADFVCYGLTFNGPIDLGSVRNIVYRDCKWPGSSAWPPFSLSFCKTSTFENCLIDRNGADIEVDKNIELLTFRNCRIGGYYNALLFQSSSIQRLVIDGCDIYSLQGTPKNTYINNSRIAVLVPGPRADGAMESLFVENSIIDSLSFTGWADGFAAGTALSGWSFSNGTFSKANAGSASCPTWAVPGAKCVFEDSATGGFFRSPPFFTILDIRSDAPGVPGIGNIFIDTTLASLPAWTQGTMPNNSFLPAIMTYHPYGKIAFKNCRGTRSVMNWQSPNNPVRDGGTGFQYATILLTGNSVTTGSNNMHAEGTLQAININVLRAYTGANGSENLNVVAFETYPGGTFAGAASPTLVVNVKTAGLRSWASGSWTGSVAGDTLPAITAGTWLFGYPEFYCDNSMAGDTLAQQPVISVEIITDVGIIKYPWIEYGSTVVRS